MVSVTSTPPDNEAIRELRDEVKDLNKAVKASGEEMSKLRVSMEEFSRASGKHAFVMATLSAFVFGIAFAQFALLIFPIPEDFSYLQRLIVFVIYLAVPVTFTVLIGNLITGKKK